MNELQFAKKHIRNRFSLMVLPYVSEGLLSVYENARSICEKNNQVDQTLKTFQNLLTYIPKWDEARLNAEVERIQTASGCTYLEELLTATLVTYLRAFASVQYSTASDIEVEFERPPLPRFVHDLYKECARQSWTHAYLFKTYSTTTEQQARNRRDLDQILDVALDTTLDSFLPWKNIVEKYFKEPVVQATPAVPAVPIEPTEMMEEHKPSNSVKFEDDEEEEEPLVLSDETMSLDVEDLDKKEDEKVDLVPSEELVLNM
jgi:hypothetical protein